MALLLTACEKENPSGDGGAITLAEGVSTEQTLYADQTSSQGGIRFSADAPWHAEVVPLAASKASGEEITWVSLSQYSGDAGEFTLSVSLEPNYTGSDRSAAVRIVCGTSVISITVEQKASTQSGETIRFLTSADTLFIDASVGYASLSLTAHTSTASGDEPLEWTVESASNMDEGWFSVSPASGSGDTELEVRSEADVDFEIVSDTRRLPVAVIVRDESPIVEIPDPYFKKMLLGYGYDRNGDGELSEREALLIERIDFSSVDIGSVEGIRYMKNLKELNLSGEYDRAGKLTELDLRENTALESVTVDYNNLVSVDVSGCAALKTLRCTANAMTALDVAGCTSLTLLDCEDNSLKRISGLAECTALEEIYASTNELGSVDLRGLDNLRRLECRNNTNLALTLPEAKNLVYLDINNTGSTSDLILSGFERLEYLNFGDCEISTLDLSGCTSLRSLDPTYDGNSNASVVKLNLSGCTALTECQIGRMLKGGSLWSIDVSGCTALKTLNIDYQHVKEVDLSDCAALEEFSCEVYAMGYVTGEQDPRLQSIDVTHNPELRILNLGGAEYITRLDLSGNPQLEELICRGTDLQVLDLRHNTRLRSVNAETNTLDTIYLLPEQTVAEMIHYENTQIVREAL